MFENLRERLEELLARATPASAPREAVGALRDAVIEYKVGVRRLHEGLVETERALATERQRLEDAERRGRLAAEVPDPETVRVAEEFAVRHRERIVLLERKVAIQRDELVLAEQDLTTLMDRLRRAKIGIGEGGTSASAEAAWRDLQAAGGARPETDVADELLRHDLDRQAREQAVDAQLAHLKRKMGRDG